MKLVFVLCLFMLIGLFASDAVACTCAGPGLGQSYENWLRKESEEADYIFSAKVLSQTRPRNVDLTGTVVALRVEQVWKGLRPGTKTVLVRNERLCLASFEEGEQFLVYAYTVRTHIGKKRIHYLYTNACSPTKYLEKADKDLAILGEAKSDLAPRSKP